MIKRTLLLILIFTLPLFLFSQGENLVIEKYDKVFEVIISNPLLPDLPYGVNFRNTTNDYLTKISDGSVIVANGPCCFLGGSPPDNASLDFNSLRLTKGGNTMSEVTSMSGEGLVKVYRYSPSEDMVATLLCRRIFCR